jgi:HTH-type transcriptional regulator / antitoxin HipB
VIDRSHFSRFRPKTEKWDRSITFRKIWAKNEEMGSIDPIFAYPARMEVIADPTELGAAIRARRRLLMITQDELATSIGVSRRVIGQMENGKETVHVGIVLRAARAVGLNVGVEPRG